jgi:hypothetical protein
MPEFNEFPEIIEAEQSPEMQAWERAFDEHESRIARKIRILEWLSGFDPDYLRAKQAADEMSRIAQEEQLP